MTAPAGGAANDATVRIEHPTGPSPDNTTLEEDGDGLVQQQDL